MKILFVIGSLRKESFNKQLAASAEKLLVSKGVEVEYLQYGDLPFVNQDIEFPAPNSVVDVRNKIKSADGVWLFTPEYNFSIPPVVKNLFDWISRPLTPMQRETAISNGVKITLSGAGGQPATINARNALVNLFEFIGMKVYKDNQTGVGVPNNSWMTNVLELSANDLKSLEVQANGFVDFLKNN
ncbi:NAD(P)H-dependent oxidoreductase [Malacoplasma penetrans]|uniref:Predicted NADPH-dependent reductase n=1 Tax=Malacoplasma penetrans (strain HF-2) TaxID=272633 RepID=Q8EWA9_MALP2|nr:NADPH-dependent FMN reductase [Malacoplasma penetrans]RXY96779.1 NAD(P)H-dependent oxidoreductase [Malacoplasma penetrans]BAC44087.1 predicted NADPH-dependent reductase [Malacoplasma penetrans HF-2]